MGLRSFLSSLGSTSSRNKSQDPTSNHFGLHSGNEVFQTQEQPQNSQSDHSQSGSVAQSVLMGRVTARIAASRSNVETQLSVPLYLWDETALDKAGRATKEATELSELVSMMEESETFSGIPGYQGFKAEWKNYGDRRAELVARATQFLDAAQLAPK